MGSLAARERRAPAAGRLLNSLAGVDDWEAEVAAPAKTPAPPAPRRRAGAEAAGAACAKAVAVA